MNKKFILVLSLAFFLSRIPLLNMGFGGDLDSWVYADTCFAIFKTGKYFVSRGIGFPLYEFLTALILKVDEAVFSLDWVLPNIFSMVAAFICIILFYKILIKWEVAQKEILLLGFTFMPVIWKNSTNTMDYMLSLIFILLSHYLIIQGKYSLSAIALGFAVGARPTNGVMLFPLLYLIWRDKKEEVTRFIVIFSLISFSFFIPFLYVYKTFSLEQYKNYMYPPSTSLMYLLKIGYRIFYELIGLNAAIFLLILIPFSKEGWEKFFKLLREKDLIITFSTLTIIFFLALFLKYPFQPDYLIPLIPCSFILIGIFFKKRNLTILLFLVILNGFLTIPGINFNFNTKGEVNINPEFITKGTLISDIEKRENFTDFRKIFPKIYLKDHSIAILHEYQAVYVYFNRYQIFKTERYFDSKRNLTSLYYVYNPEKDIYMAHLVLNELIDLVNDYNIYYIPCAVRVNKSKADIDLLKYNPILLSQLKPMDY